MSTEFTVRIPSSLAEKMRKYRVDWSEVIRKAIEEHIRMLEGRKAVPAEEVLEELIKDGIKSEDLEPLPPERERELYRRMRDSEKRLSKTQVE